MQQLTLLFCIFGVVHDEGSYGKQGQEMKGGLFLCNPELSINASQAEITQPIVSCRRLNTADDTVDVCWLNQI